MGNLLRELLGNAGRRSCEIQSSHLRDSLSKSYVRLATGFKFQRLSVQQAEAGFSMDK